MAGAARRTAPHLAAWVRRAHHPAGGDARHRRATEQQISVGPNVNDVAPRHQRIPDVGVKRGLHREAPINRAPPRRVQRLGWPNTLIGPGDAIVLSPDAREVDYEAELGVVIGSGPAACPSANAFNAVRGYICVNDVSADIIAYIGRIITLEPGDLIATGTPAGVGSSATPRSWRRTVTRSPSWLRASAR